MRTRTGLLLMLVLALGAIGSGISRQAAAQVPDVLVVGRGPEATSLDPHKGGNEINIYDTLIVRDPQWNLKPGLAVSWRNVDPTTWELKLRRGVKFHNGEPFNAQTVRFSFERGLNPTTKWVRAGLFRLVKSVAVVDDYTVRVTTERPWPLFLSTVATFGLVIPPRHMEKNGEEALVRRPVGTGPYRFVRWIKDDRLELEANPEYWGGRPKIARLVIRTIPNNATRLAELLAGSVHVIEFIPPETFGPIQRSPRTKLLQARSTGGFFVLLNLVNIPQNRPLADRRVRQALNYAVDRKAMIASLMHNLGAPIATFCTEVMFGCDMSIPPFPHDPERARTLLRQAGYPDGFDMTISSTSGVYPGDRDLTLAVADQLTQVGIRVRVVVTEFGIHLRQFTDRKFPYDAGFLRFTDFVGSAASIPFRAFHTKGGFSLWVPANREFEQLLETLEVTLDETRAKEMYRRAQLLFKEEAPGIPLITAPYAFGLHRNLEWTPRPGLYMPYADAEWTRR